MPELSVRLGDLQECNNEQIHLSGAVQSHGALLLYSADDLRIQACSANAKQILGIQTRSITGAKLNHIFEESFAERVKKIQAAHPWRSPGVYLIAKIGEQSFDVYMFKTGSHFALEFEPFKLEERTAESENILQDFMSETKAAKDIVDLSNLACKYIREIAGIDRVMMYRFLPPAWHGEVIGEDRVMGTHSFMHHRFPSSDIPKPARDLYLRNKVRLIPNSRGDISPIEPNLDPNTGKVWDLSDSRLRSVSPIHMEYLRNMAVAGSMSFAVIVKGELWGLIACHSLTEFTLSNAKRAICCAIADVVSGLVGLMQDLDGLLLRSTFEVRLKKIIEQTLISKDPLSGLLKQHSLIIEAFNATGLAICNFGHSEISGIVPPPSMLKQLHERLLAELNKIDKDIISFRDIRELVPDWGAKLNVACGIMAARIGDKEESLFILFRPELVRMITWGGDPVKNLEKKNFTGQINPRASFESWQEKIEHQSLPWTSFETDGMAFLKEVLFDSALVKKMAIDQLTESLKGRGNK